MTWTKVLTDQIPECKHSATLEISPLEPRPEWVAHQLTHLADWMIRTGEHLHERYDSKTLHTGHSHATAY